MNIGMATSENFESYVKIFDNLYTKTIGTFSQGRSPAECDRQAYRLRFSPTDMPYTPPDWRGLLTHQEPAMSDADYEQAIIAQAHRDCAVGSFADSVTYDVLSHSFIQCVSPDRQEMYWQSMTFTNNRMNAACAIFDENKRSVLYWNDDSQTWMVTLTSEEKARSRIFGDIYSTAWNEFNLAMEALNRQQMELLQDDDVSEKSTGAYSA